MHVRSLAQALAVDAPFRRRERGEARGFDVFVAIDAATVAAPRHPQQRGVDVADRFDVPLHDHVFEIGDHRRDGLVASIGRLARELAYRMLAPANQLVMRVRDKPRPLHDQLALQVVHLMRSRFRHRQIRRQKHRDRIRPRRFPRSVASPAPHPLTQIKPRAAKA